MQVIGLCRFSYPALGGFQIEHASTAAREAYLYAPARMDERLAAFEALTLPSLRAQTDPDFTFLVVTGTSLPAAYRDRLNEALADIPQAVLKPMAPARHRPVMRRAINSVRVDATSPCLQFRLDDDDAVACDFVASLRQAASDAHGLIARHGRVAIDFNQGYLVRTEPDGVRAAPIRKPLMTAALGVAFLPGDTKCVMNFGHHKLAEEMPVLSLTGTDMFLRGIGGSNDSAKRFRLGEFDFAPLTPAQKQLFQTRFGLDPKTLA